MFNRLNWGTFRHFRSRSTLIVHTYVLTKNRNFMKLYYSFYNLFFSIVPRISFYSYFFRLCHSKSDELWSMILWMKTKMLGSWTFLTRGEWSPQGVQNRRKHKLSPHRSSPLRIEKIFAKKFSNRLKLWLHHCDALLTLFLTMSEHFTE